MKYYDEEALREIDEKADLFSYVSGTFEMEQRGENYFTHCPKHTDETPSLCFTPSKNMCFCFSCGRGGGTIKYLMDYEGLPFDEAVEKAAEIAEFDLSKICQSQTVSFLKRIKNMYLNFRKEKEEHNILDEIIYKKYKHEPVQEWLHEGIRQDVLDKFQIRVDPFSNRIVYPVRDINGNLINIKGRTRYPEYKKLKIPKYINYYSVGVMDYFQGLDITLPYVKQQNEIIIFESIKSVMKCYGWGYKNCASAEKHTLTDEQIDLLVQLRVNVVFAYDKDVDYRKNDVRSGIDKLKRITNVYIITDPYDLLGGKESKNAPADMGKEIWESLYKAKKKVI